MRRCHRRWASTISGTLPAHRLRRRSAGVAISDVWLNWPAVQKPRHGAAAHVAVPNRHRWRQGLGRRLPATVGRSPWGAMTARLFGRDLESFPEVTPDLQRRRSFWRNCDVPAEVSADGRRAAKVHASHRSPRRSSARRSAVRAALSRGHLTPRRSGPSTCRPRSPGSATATGIAPSGRAACWPGGWSTRRAVREREQRRMGHAPEALHEPEGRLHRREAPRTASCRRFDQAFRPCSTT